MLKIDWVARYESLNKNFKSLVGLDDYMFLINDTNGELRQHCLNWPGDYYSFKGRPSKDFSFVVFPDKSLVYKHKLPIGLHPVYRPGIDRLNNTGRPYLDLYSAFVEENDTYFKTDSHLNWIGGYIATKAICKSLGLQPIPPLEHFLFQNRHFRGDLISVENHGKRPSKSEIILRPTIDESKLGFTYDKHNLDGSIRPFEFTDSFDMKLWVYHGKGVARITNPQLSGPRILVFHDSFFEYVFPYFKYSVADLYLYWSRYYSPDLVAKIKPDFIIEAKVERFLKDD